jgi:predicted DCC family thiol-disulfide oxidoreductase YuxK
MTDPAPGSTDELATEDDDPSADSTVEQRPAGESEAPETERTPADLDRLLAEGPILLFDGVCNLCNWTVQFVIRNDPEGRFRFAPLQSEVGEALVEYCGVETERLESFVMIDADEVYVKSDAGLHVLKELGLPWSLAYPLIVFPRFVRNVVYDLVATYRYRVFGRKDQCMIPDEDVSNRFLG